MVDENQIKWDKRFLRMAREAASWSKDPSTKCGAVLVRRDKTVASMGYNGFPRGLNDHENLYADRDLKLSRTIHAEMNAILTAPVRPIGYTLYVWPFSPCDRCAVHIIQSGVERIVFTLGDEMQQERWKRSFDAAMAMCHEANVDTCLYPDID